MNSSIPALFVHTGKSWYLPYTLRHALTVNPTGGVALLHDQAAAIKLSQVGSCLLENLTAPAITEFRERYLHMSSNPEGYELICWLRWFYLLEYMKANQIAKAMYFDSDVLIFRSTEYVMDIYAKHLQSCAFVIPEQDHTTYRWMASGGISYWTQDALEDFCHFALASFQEKRWLDLYKEKWQWHQKNRKPGGINDMTGFYLYWQQHASSITNLAVIYQNGTFDTGFHTSANFTEDEYEFDMNAGHKVVRKLNGHPHFIRQEQPIAAQAIHFAGSTRKYIRSYYQGPPFVEDLLWRTSTRAKHIGRMFARQVANGK